MERVVMVVVCVVGLLTARVSYAEQHVVGGSHGWEESADFSSWASAQTFKLGDQLVFKYSGLHSVVELGSETAYKSCDTGTSLNSMSTGNDVVKLTKPGARYFACGTPGHCDQGMKVKINVAGAPSSSGSSTSSGSSSDSGSDSGSASHAPRALVGDFLFAGLLLVTGLMCLF